MPSSADRSIHSAPLCRLLALQILVFVLFGPAFCGPPALLTKDDSFDNQPCALRARDGTIWVAWVGNRDNRADNVFIRSLPVGGDPSGGWSLPARVTPKDGEYFRPTLAEDRKGRVWLFWTRNTRKLAGVYAAVYDNGRWSDPVPIAAGDGASQNQEVCTDRNGTIWLAWQTMRNSSYDIYLKSFDGVSWSREIPVAQAPRNEWDPVVAADGKGVIWVGWSAYEGNGYTLYIAPFANGKLGPRVTIALDDRYNIHPWICIDSSDRVWITWDSVALSYHGSSGTTTITGANLKGEIRERRGSGGKAESFIKLACYDGKTVYEPAVPRSKHSAAPERYSGSHAGMPKIVIDKKGNLYITHRARVAQTNPRRYHWDVVIERYSGGKWLDPISLPRSDGVQEEASIAPLGENGFLVAYEMEHRDRFKGGLEPEEEKEEEEAGHHHDGFVNVGGHNGDIYAAVVPLVEGRTDFAQAMKPVRDMGKAGDSPLASLDPVFARTAHSINLRGKIYNLYWGDLHKHSNVSRCSQGAEPSPEDHYIYSHDVCRYDFMAMSDHAEHTSLYNWWRLQKLADLYYIPGWFVPMIGYEWTAQYPAGHKNVIFPGRPAPLIRAAIDGSRTGKELWSILGDRRAITIPHTSASKIMGQDWGEHDPKYQRLVEIFQASRGSFEAEGCPRQWTPDTANKKGFAQAGLAKGRRTGIICSSDHGYGVSYAIVYAERADRESVYQALYDRRCYGSTAYGTVLEFRADGHFMGEEYKSSSSPKVEIYAAGPCNIRSVEIIKNNQTVYFEGSIEKPIGKTEVRMNWTDPDKVSAPNTYYYVRVIREDDEIAWSSPIWIDPPNSSSP
ncbi:MAG: DUF3604 domain-containing protein [Armatimonadota bacterium]|nr:DUF3604 domain-containing protein [Armatimonadota bacterium]